MNGMTDIATTRLTDDERIATYGRIVEVHRQLHAIFDRSLRAEVGMSIVWYEALLRLARSPENQLPINTLGQQMQLTSGGATRLVDRIEEAGYLERLACPSDRRVAWAHLTPAGRAAVEAATDVHLRDLERFIASKLSLSETEQLGTLLDRIRCDENLRSVDPDG